MATARPNPRPAVGAAAVVWQKVLKRSTPRPSMRCSGCSASSSCCRWAGC